MEIIESLSIRNVFLIIIVITVVIGLISIFAKFFINTMNKR